MKNKIIITALLSLFVCSLFAQKEIAKEQKLTAEETVVKKVIDDYIMYFDQRDYDKWATCVAHDPMTSFTWASPYAGENGYIEAKGWDKVNEIAKAFMAEHAPVKKPAKITDYQFKTSGNMAFVTCMENSKNQISCVLEKKKGQWKVLSFEGAASESFHHFQQLYALHRMAGEWEVDMSTYKKEGGGSWKLQSGKMAIERTPTGLESREVYRYLDENNKNRTSEDVTVFALNMNTGKIGVFIASHYPNSNWTNSTLAVGSFNDDGQLICESQRIGDESNTKGDWRMWMDGDNLNWSVVVKNDKGEQIYSASCTYRRAETVMADAKP